MFHRLGLTCSSLKYQFKTHFFFSFQETYSSFHYTSLLYLNEYQRDFQGGRFIFLDENKADNVTLHSLIEPKRGRVSVFTSGAENLHHIEKVTEGTRYAMTISFTCNRKFAITDPAEQK